MENAFLKKLHIKTNYIVKIENAPQQAAAIFGEIPGDVDLRYDNTQIFEVLIVFAEAKDLLNFYIEKNLNQINPKTIFWVFYPKKSSKVKSDLDLMDTWKDLNVYNLTPCAAVSVNEVWTGLRLKFISEVKPSGTCNDDIKTGELSKYIDVTNKLVTLPTDLAEALSPHPTALNYFNQLAYSHKKEYVLWILTAKQDKTRQSRIEKAVNMLLNGKKNPSVKN